MLQQQGVFFVYISGVFVFTLAWLEKTKNSTNVKNSLNFINGTLGHYISFSLYTTAEDCYALFSLFFPYVYFQFLDCFNINVYCTERYTNKNESEQHCIVPRCLLYFRQSVNTVNFHFKNHFSQMLL